MSTMITYENYESGGWKKYVIYHAKDNLGSADGSYRPVTIHMTYQKPQTARVLTEGYTDLESHVPEGVEYWYVEPTPIGGSTQN